jgi:hypothetical protein
MWGRKIGGEFGGMIFVNPEFCASSKLVLIEYFVKANKISPTW